MGRDRGRSRRRGQTVMFLNGGSCGGGSVVNTMVQTGDGLNHPWAYSAVGTT